MITKTRAVLSICAVLVAITGWPLAASAATINFASLSQPGSGSGTAFVDEGLLLNFGGLTFSSTSLSGAVSKLILWDSSDAFHPAGGDATTSLMEYAASDTTTITKTGGGVFDLFSISLTEYGPVNPALFPTFDVTFTGTKPDTSTVIQTFTVSNNTGAPNLQGPFNFSGFTGLSNVTVTQGTYAAGTAFQFDNLQTTDLSSPAAVPEPVTVLLVGSGLLGAAARRRRSRQ